MNCDCEKIDQTTLILQVRDGDQAAFCELLRRYRPLLDSAVARFGSSDRMRVYEDDLRQEATLVFYNALLNYDVDNESVEFGLYAKICVTNALITEVRRLERSKAEELAELSEDALGEDAEPSDTVIENESIERIDAIIRSNLSSLEYRVWCLYASGRSASEIGALLGKSEKSVSNAVYRIRKKLREQFK